MPAPWFKTPYQDQSGSTGTLPGFRVIVQPHYREPVQQLYQVQQQNLVGTYSGSGLKPDPHGALSTRVPEY